ncbi:DUF1648 domain-containing protein [Agromyces sp. NPDC058110]|uniref:DUF1648 domain-containing protein n=1 Tax=Agromyces sp. NPDC058110 TaxID=3346345 RepID=UPI0036DC7B23
MNDPVAATSVDARERDRHDRRVLLAVVVWVPLAIVLVSTVIQLIWIPRMPDEVAVHWNAAGEPDRWTTPGRAVLAYAVISLSLILALAIASFAGARALRPHAGSPTRLLSRVRPTASFAPATIVMVSLVMVGLGALQLDGAQPPQWAAPVVIGVGLLVGALVWWITWRALPAPDRTAADTPSATPALDLAPGERAVWTATASAPWPVIALIGFALVAVIVPFVLSPSSWWLWALVFVLVLVLASTAWIRVTVDRRGLTVRSLVGIRLTRVPLEAVVAAADVEVLPAEFGGWGFRFDVHGRRGIIIRSGQGIEVERADAPPLVVTVADARTGAALLNALVQAGR